MFTACHESELVKIVMKFLILVIQKFLQMCQVSSQDLTMI